jgi:phosphohistidine phosphatase
MGHYLADEDLRPDLALVSPARRTEETWNLAKESLGSVPARSEPRIYEAPPDLLIEVVNGVEPGVGTLLLVGHNPGMEELLHILIPLQERYGRAGSIPKFPTAGLAVVNVPAAYWRELSPRSAHLERFVTPKSLGLGEDE